MKLSAELWREVEPLLSHALELGPDERRGWLEGVDTTHPKAAPMLRRMLATHERAERASELETASLVASAALRSHVHAAGQAVGPFVLISPLGRGGMGEVWLARHADGHLERNVALKLPVSHQQGEVARERFRRERDILARLEHPNIARLYDAGVTEHGQPWLAMEVVTGVPLTQAARELPIPARLALFRQVLAAVALAHRHLIVHRDLKPANILVDAAGQVKLLDFGIAKLIEAEARVADDLTRAGGRVMTLRYAAPEQVAAGEITTATDIYSLGVLLHELLTGQSPYRAVREGRAFTELELVQAEAGAPSRLGLPRPVARALQGDLDAIVLKALRVEARERYASVDQLDADIAAHLERRPVQARRGTWRYRAGRFVLRHKLPLGAAAAILAVLAGGVWMAERERQVAVAEKARAERHLARVRKLANTFIFQTQSDLEKLPGSIDARMTLVRTSMEYLDALAAEAGNDAGLLLELAGGYSAIGRMQGQAGGPNRGELETGLKNMQKAKALFARLDHLAPRDLASLRAHLQLSYSLARALFYLESGPGWEPEIAHAVRLAERLAALPGATRRDRAQVATMRSEQAALAGRARGYDEGLARVMAETVAQLEALLREDPADRKIRHHLILAYDRAATLYGIGSSQETVARAIAYYRKVLPLARQAVADEPDDPLVRLHAVDAMTDLANLLSTVGGHREAAEMMAQAVQGYARMVERDPSDRDLRFRQAQMTRRAAYSAFLAGDTAKSLRYAREALAILAQMPPEMAGWRRMRGDVAIARFFVGASLCTMATPQTAGEARVALHEEAHPHLAHALEFLDEVERTRWMILLPAEIAFGRDVIQRCGEARDKLRAARQPRSGAAVSRPSARSSPSSG